MLRQISLDRTTQGNQPHGCCPSVLVLFRQRLDPSNVPSTVTCRSFQGLDLPKKLDCECGFAPEALIPRIASQAQVQVTCSRFESPPENAQLLLAQVKQHVRLAPRSCWRSVLCPKTKGRQPTSTSRWRPGRLSSSEDGRASHSRERSQHHLASAAGPRAWHTLCWRGSITRGLALFPLL